MTNRFLAVLVLFFALASSAPAQEDCTKLKNKGQTEYNQDNYERAKVYFTAALKVCDDKTGIADWIDKCDAGIQKKKRDAEAAAKAEKERQAAEQQRKAQEQAKKEQAAKEEAAEQQRKAQEQAKKEQAAKEEAAKQQQQQTVSQTIDIPMVYVDGGTFTMGCTSEQGGGCYDDEKPAHSVTLSSYYIGKYEVTQAQWKAVMDSNPSHFKGDNLPVESVSWNDVQEFIRKLNQKTGKNYRLPTEAEWEFAARGGGSSRGYKYSGSNTVGNVAWYTDNSGSTTHTVGTKQANELGIYDMSGNVWEWCSDWYGSYSSGSQTNPRGASTGSYRVLRGGSWYINARNVRVSNRDYNSPEYRGFNYGFRLALSSN